MQAQAQYLIALILFSGILCQWLSWRFKIPSIIFLLATGVLAGPVLNLLNPDELLGELLFPCVSLAVAIILFEGSLTLNFRDIPGLQRVIRNLITTGVLVTWLLTTLTTRWLLHFSWEISFLFAAVMVVTGPTVIMPLLQTVRPKEKIANVLQWEGILLDPIGAVLAVLVFEFIVSSQTTDSLIHESLLFGKMILIGVMLGIAGGYCLGLLLRRYWIPLYLHNFTALVLVTGIYALSNKIELESGLLSVTVMGIWLTNFERVDLKDILSFKESLSIILISVLFIILAARVNLQDFMQLGLPALYAFLVIQFLIRPISVHLCALRSKLTFPERHFLAWIAPRGIVAAAISALFAIRLQGKGYDGANEIVPMTFCVIFGTVILQSITAKPLAKWLKVAEDSPTGFFIIGANPIARAICKQLARNGFKTLLASQNWNEVRDAKLQGFNAYWGNPVSEHAERHLELGGIGNFLALTPYKELNILAAQYYRLQFGPAHMYMIRNQNTQKKFSDEQRPVKYGVRELFNQTISFQDIQAMLDKGAEFKTTQLTETFSFKDYLNTTKEERYPLFAIDPGKKIHIFSSDAEVSPGKQWKIISLSNPVAESSRQHNRAGKPHNHQKSGQSGFDK